MNDIYTFLDELRRRKIHFTLASYREKSIMIIISVPGERWECEFFDNGMIEVEIFKSSGEILGDECIKVLYEKHSDI